MVRNNTSSGLTPPLMAVGISLATEISPLVNQNGPTAMPSKASLWTSPLGPTTDSAIALKRSAIPIGTVAPVAVTMGLAGSVLLTAIPAPATTLATFAGVETTG